MFIVTTLCQCFLSKVLQHSRYFAVNNLISKFSRVFLDFPKIYCSDCNITLFVGNKYVHIDTMFYKITGFASIKLSLC